MRALQVRLRATVALSRAHLAARSLCSPPQFRQAVAENIMHFDHRFWLRLAARSDTAADEGERAQLVSLATSVMQLVDSILKQTEEQLSDSATHLQDILKAAADENGEWQVPLAPEKLEAMKQVGL